MSTSPRENRRPSSFGKWPPPQPRPASFATSLSTGRRDTGCPPELAEDLKLAAYEAMANAVTHAYPEGVDGTMTVTASLEPGTVAITITITDSGRWRDGASGTHGGRGLVLIRALTPEVSVTSTPIGTTVRMVWPWSPP